MVARNVDYGKSDILSVTIVVWNESNVERLTSLFRFFTQHGVQEPGIGRSGRFSTFS